MRNTIRQLRKDIHQVKSPGTKPSPLLSNIETIPEKPEKSNFHPEKSGFKTPQATNGFKPGMGDKSPGTVNANTASTVNNIPNNMVIVNKNGVINFK